MFNVDNDLDMPRDVIHGECLCQIIGRNEIVIENYKCIKSITDTDIEIVCKKYKIKKSYSHRKKLFVAERVGFEPTVHCCTTDFESASL